MHGLVGALPALVKGLDRKGALNLEEQRESPRSLRTEVPNEDPEASFFDAVLEMLDGEIDGRIARKQQSVGQRRPPLSAAMHPPPADVLAIVMGEVPGRRQARGVPLEAHLIAARARLPAALSPIKVGRPGVSAHPTHQFQPRRLFFLDRHESNLRAIFAQVQVRRGRATPSQHHPTTPHLESPAYYRS